MSCGVALIHIPWKPPTGVPSAKPGTPRGPHGYFLIHGPRGGTALRRKWLEENARDRS